MIGAGVPSGMRWMGVALMLALSVGCSKASDPNDPASQYENTDWVFERKGIELHLEDGEAQLVNHQTEKSASLTYSVDAGGNVVLEGEALGGKLQLMRDSNGNLSNQMKDLYFRQKTAEDSDKLSAQDDAREAAKTVREAKRPSTPDGYRLLQGDDFKFLFASRMPDLTDDVLAGVFIQGYDSESGAFKKQEMLQSQLPSIKSRLSEMAKVTDFRFNTYSDKDLTKWNTALSADVLGGTMIGAVDPSTQSFPFSQDLSACSHNSPGQGSFSAGSGLPTAGVNYAFRAWGNMNEPVCQIKVSDLNAARQIEDARAHYNLQVRTTVYARMTGDKQADHWLLDVHRIDVQFYRQGQYDHQARHNVYEQIPGIYTLTDL